MKLLGHKAKSTQRTNRVADALLMVYIDIYSPSNCSQYDSFIRFNLISHDLTLWSVIITFASWGICLTLTLGVCFCTHICVGNLSIIGPDNGLSPGRRQSIISTNARILFMVPWGTNRWNFNRSSSIFIQENTFENVVCEMASILSRPQCVKTTPKPAFLYSARVLFSQFHRF